MRLDPAGAFRSHEVEKFCDDHSIFLDVIPGEAHWKLGTCEQAVKGIKELMTKLSVQNLEETPETLLAESVRTFNQRELIRGFSPTQHVLGKAPDETGRFVNSLVNPIPETWLANPLLEFEKTIHLQKEAEQALSEWQAKQRTTRALNSRSSRKLFYHPGDLVYFWRKQVQNRTGKHGMFLGPARVLAVESKRDEDGSLRPGSSVWCVRGRRLVKCCPEQLRPATLREELVEHLSEPSQDTAPWTFPRVRVVEQLGAHEYEDVSMEVPTEETWQAAQDPREALPPTRRHTQKRPADPPAPIAEPPTTIRRSHPSGSAEEAPLAEAWWAMVPEIEFQTAEGQQFWSDEGRSVEIEIPMPESRRGVKSMVQDLEGYFVNVMRRQAVEVSEKRLTPAEKEQFREAKNVEVKNFLAAQAFSTLPRHLQPKQDQAIGMRWILTWKLKDDGTTKAKARAVLKGYQDDQYENRATTTPVMTRLSRQLLLQVAAQKRWKVRKGDVSGAFLQGRRYPGDLYCLPLPEIAAAMNLSQDEVVKVNRGCYGSVDAPLEWYRTVSEFFATLGLIKSWSDPCCWLWKPAGQLRGIISGHVDDFMFIGSATDMEWQAIEARIREHFKWSEWEEDNFVQCGVRIAKQPDGSYHLSQPDYIDKISEIPINSTRRKETHLSTTDREKTMLRATLGGISWHAQQVAPHFSAEVSLLLSEVSTSTVQTIIKTNQFLTRARARKDHFLKIHAHAPDQRLGMFAWVDASGQNRPKGGSAQGIFIGMAPEELLKGSVEDISPIAWHSSKIDRVVRSPGAAEAAATVDGEDLLYHARLQYGEWLEPQTDVFDVDSTVHKVMGVVISDSRNVYDKLQTEELSVKGAERRTDFHILSQICTAV